MSIKTIAAKAFAKIMFRKTQAWVNHPVETQQKVLRDLIRQAKHTQFGLDHHFDKIKTFADFARNVPVCKRVLQ